MYVCMYIYMYVYVYIYVSMYMCICIYMYGCACTSFRLYVRIYVGEFYVCMYIFRHC